MCDSYQAKDIPDLNYYPPEWSSPPTDEYCIEIVKNGTVIEKIIIEERKPFFVIGRLPICELSLEHASVSRYHAIIQFAKEGAFLYDLNSTHGSFLNKQKVEPQVFVPIPPDSILKFGESTRSYIFSATRRNPPALQLWRSDPEKFLRHRLSGLGIDLNVETRKCDQEYEASIHIPSDELNLDADIFESQTGKTKKDALKGVALKVCEKLYAAGLFPGEEQELVRHAVYKPDDSTDYFFDRTKTLGSPKRKAEMETFGSLKSQMELLEKNIGILKAQKGELEEKMARLESPDCDDEMEMYLNSLARTQLGQDIQRCCLQLEKEEAEYRRVAPLYEIAKPFDWEERDIKRAKFGTKEGEDSEKGLQISERVKAKEHAEVKEVPFQDFEESDSDGEETEHPLEPSEQIYLEDTAEVAECPPPSSSDRNQIEGLKRKYGY